MPSGSKVWFYRRKLLDKTHFVSIGSVESINKQEAKKRAKIIDKEITEGKTLSIKVEKYKRKKVAKRLTSEAAIHSY